MWPTQQPRGGSETLRCASAVGPARAPSDRTEGGPTGTTDIFSGRGGCRGGGAYRTLHYAAAMVRTPENHSLEGSTSIKGVSG